MSNFFCRTKNVKMPNVSEKIMCMLQKKTIAVYSEHFWPDSPWLLLFSVRNHCFQCGIIVFSAEPLLSVRNHCFDQRGIVFERSRDTAHGLGSPIQPYHSL